MKFLKDSIAQMNYIGMEYSIASTFSMIYEWSLDSNWALYFHRERFGLMMQGVKCNLDIKVQTDRLTDELIHKRG